VFRGLRKSVRESAAKEGTAARRSEGEGARRGRGAERGAGASQALESHESKGAAAGSTTLRPTSASQLAAYRKAVENLELQLVGKDRSLPECLKELMERWNPLYDSQARTELVEDVNAMIRDYFRNLKRTFRASPPSAGRIRDLAAKLSENKSFDRIKRKDVFVQYIQLYMLKLMGER